MMLYAKADRKSRNGSMSPASGRQNCGAHVISQVFRPLLATGFALEIKKVVPIDTCGKTNGISNTPTSTAG